MKENRAIEIAPTKIETASRVRYAQGNDTNSHNGKLAALAN
jgi:hypothetical protein